MDSMNVFGNRNPRNLTEGRVDVTESNVERITNQSLEVKSNRMAYDSAFKKFFRRKEVLAIILREIVDEFKGMDLEAVADCITESKVNDLDAETLSEEDVTFDSKIIYDLVVYCSLPKTFQTIAVGIIFDLEMQRKYSMSYEIIDRAVYYASRHLAKQSVKNSTYDQLLPVYSTWICLKGIHKELQNTVHSFRLRDNAKNCIIPKKSLINIDLLLLSEKYDCESEYNTDEPIIKFLQAIFKDNLRNKELNPYLKVTEEIEREVDAIMVEQSKFDLEIISEREDARREGLAEGLAEGIEQGIERLLAKGVNDDFIKDLGYTEEEISKVKEKVQKKQ